MVTTILNFGRFCSPEFLISLLFGLGVFASFWILGTILKKSILRLTLTHQHNPALINLLGSATQHSCTLLGAISLAGSCGVDIRGILAGLGLTGFALGFALKDLLANTIAGIFILLYRPFNIGQEIKLETTKGCIDQGKVTAIDLRYTKLENATETILIPNSIIFTNSISILK